MASLGILLEKSNYSLEINLPPFADLCPWATKM
jgi:hypothetical protein